MCDDPFYVTRASGDRVPVPCGRCPPCKRRRVDSWVFRLMQEEKVSSSAHFVTLTYDTRFVPITENGFMTLCKEDFQNYMKRLRKLCLDSKLKYYAVGEYGSTRERPHYHAIIFNVPDKELFYKAWHIDNVPRGTCFVGTVTGQSVAYCMKYIDKPRNRREHSRDDRLPEFALMSNGLGSSYITQEVVDYHAADLSRMFVTVPGGYRKALPRYYRNLIYTTAEMEQQISLAQQASEKADEMSRLHFERMYKGSDITFEQWKENRRLGRHTQFYSQQKSRDI